MCVPVKWMQIKLAIFNFYIIKFIIDHFLNRVDFLVLFAGNNDNAWMRHTPSLSCMTDRRDLEVIAIVGNGCA